MLDRFARAIVFVKPDLVVVYDRLRAPTESSFEYWLHAVEQFDVADQENIGLRVGDVRCAISLLAPENLEVRQTDQYSPNPRERIKLREFHLTASTPKQTKAVEFVAAYRPYEVDQQAPQPAQLSETETGYALEATLADGRSVRIVLPKHDGPIEIHRVDRPTVPAVVVPTIR